MDSPEAPSAPSRSAPRTRAACRSLPRRSKCASPPPARSCHQTLNHGTQCHHIHGHRTAKRSFRESNLHRPQSTSDSICFRVSHGSLIGYLHRQELRGRNASQPSFTIELSPVKDLVRVHLVPPRHACHRRARLQGLFHDLAPLLRTPPPFLPTAHPHTHHLVRCVHDSSSWTQKCPQTPSSPTTHTSHRRLESDAYSYYGSMPRAT